MIELFILITITSIWILGLTIITQEDMAFDFVREYADKKAEGGQKIFKPLIACTWCMPSVHFVFGYLFAIGLGVVSIGWHLVIMIPLVIMGSSLVCGLIWSFYEMISAKTSMMIAEEKYYTQVEKLAYYDIKDRVSKFQKKEHGIPKRSSTNSL